ncbi:unnamed protein product [Ectocarpus sp. CCAP 1310/34]|nr:unnamed protein product [Ectocarpus sp. CCAP 1310/34]
MADDMLETATAENCATGRSQRVGLLSGAQTGARLLPPVQGEAAAENGSKRSVGVADVDRFNAGLARAAQYRSEAGCDHDYHEADSDSSPVDVDDQRQQQAVGLSWATRSLMGGRALSQAFTACGSDRQPTWQHPSAVGEEGGNTEEDRKVEDPMLVEVGGEDGDGCSPDAGGQHDGVLDALSGQVTAGSMSPPPPPSLLQGRGAIPPPPLSTTVAAAPVYPPPDPLSSSSTPGSR